MRQTIIGVFAKYADAQHAARTLQSSGFDESVFLTDAADGLAGAHVPARDGVMTQMRQFFTALFGSGSSERVVRYADTVCRGGALVRVEIERERDLETVRDALQNAGAIDIEERTDVAGAPDTLPFHRDTTASQHIDSDELRGDFAAYDAEFRNDFETWHSGTGSLYDDYEPAYRYGHFLANDESYAGRRWEEFEPDARRYWERLHPRRAWQRVKTAVRHAWQRTLG